MSSYLISRAKSAFTITLGKAAELAATMKVFASLVFATLVIPAFVYGSKWEDGFEEGWKNGWSDGWDESKSRSYSPPSRGNFAQGMDAWKTGYDAGKFAGYRAGREAGIDYFGQPGQPFELEFFFGKK